MASFIDLLRTRVSAFVVLGLAFAPAAAQSAPPAVPRYTVVELQGAVPMNLNNKGEMAGWINVGGMAHAAIYRNGAWIDYGVLSGDQVSAFYKVNDAGAAVGFSFGQLQPPIPPDTFVNNRWRAAWAPAGAQAIELLSEPPADSFAYGINEAGAIVGCRNRYDDVFPDPHRAFLYANGVLTDLHDLLSTNGSFGFDFTCARDVNNDGVVVGEVQLQNSPSRGYFYRDGSVTRLGSTEAPFLPPFLTNARAVNDQGKIVGEGRLAAFQADHAMLYDLATGSITSLGVEATGAYNSKPNDLNGAGDVVGTMFLPNGERAFLVTGGQAVDLNDRLAPGTDWVLQEAFSINDRGLIVGRGLRLSDPQTTRYFLLDPTNMPPTVSLPEQLGVNEGESTALVATVSDEAPQSVTYAWSVIGSGAIANENGSTASYAAGTADGTPGASSTVRVTITDDEGLTATAETVVTIANVAPSATFSASPGSVYVGEVVTLALTGASDPSAADSAAGFTFAFACSATEAMGALAPASSRSCSYAAPGPQVVRGRIADKDGGLNDYSVTVSVQSHQEGVAGLIQLVQALQVGGAFDAGNANSLTTKLQGAIAQLNQGNVGPAVNKLEAFIQEVEAFIQTGKLSPAQGQPLIDGARHIIDALI